MGNQLFSELTTVLAIGVGIAVIMRLLKQPLIIGHILTGILVGPSALKLVTSHDTMEIFSKLGIALLLFIVGLGLNPRVIRELGKVSLLTGGGQVLFTSIVGYVIAKALGFDSTTSIFLSTGLSFSSTIIVLKLLTDKKEQHKLHGRISIGFLLVQDIIATIALVVASATGKGGLDIREFTLLGLHGIALAGTLYLVATYVLPRLSTFLSASQELLFLFALAWAFGVGAVFIKSGFSLEVGALFAGIALAHMNYASEIAARLKPLRDFFIVVFFISLGASLDLHNLASILPYAFVFTLYILIGNPIIVMCILGLLGYTRKTSFKTSLTVAQVSEFSLIFILLGNTTGQVEDRAVTTLTVVALVTFAVSSYMIIYADKLYGWLEKYLRMFERRKVRFEQENAHKHEVIVIGYKKGGIEFIKTLRAAGKKFIVIDYDPEAIDEMESKNISFVYGDAVDPELLDEIGIDTAQFVMSTTTDIETNRSVLQILQSANPDAIYICNTDTPEHAVELYEHGASYVMIPHSVGSERISAFIRQTGFKKSEFRKFREKQLQELHAHLT